MPQILGLDTLEIPAGRVVGLAGPWADRLLLLEDPPGLLSAGPV
jgi:hypothetical protein